MVVGHISNLNIDKNLSGQSCLDQLQQVRKMML